MRRCWERVIRGRWRSRLAWSLAAALAAASHAQSLETLTRAHWQKRTPATERAVLAFAAANPAGQSGALALLNAAVVALQQQRWADSARHAAAARTRLTALSDFVAYARGEAALHQDNFSEAVDELSAVLSGMPASPLAGQAALLLARAHLGRGAPEEAIRLLDRHWGSTSEPRAALVAAQCHEARRDPAAAVIAYQRIYYEHPASPEEREAAEALARLRRALGESYPPPLAGHMLERAGKLSASGQTARAIAELEEMIPRLGGASRDLARVRIGAARHASRNDAAALEYLRALPVDPGDADAERLYYLLASARRLGNHDAVREALARLERGYPASPWRLEALLAAANQALVDNQPLEYEPLYRACYESFPADPRAAGCHWKVAWRSWLDGRPERGAWLRAHIERYPSSENVPAALYFLGRLAQSENDPASANLYFLNIVAKYPNYYYAILAGEKLRPPGPGAQRPSPAVETFLATVRFPPLESPRDFRPDAATARRIERARLLWSAGLDPWAESELRFGARTDSLPHLAAMELGLAATKRGEHDRGVFLLRAVAGDYMNWPLESAPPEFWKIAFPLPFRAEVEKHSGVESLDAFLVAGLIRQESAFDPKAVSRAQAMGLAQIRPATGRELSRKLAIARFRTSMLFRPDINLRMGAYHLRTMLDAFSSNLEAALAAYNAGRSRAVAWLGWRGFSEPAEFIETIPFTETRNYVRIVLRNRDMYRRLYGGAGAAVPSSNGRASDQGRRSPAGRRAGSGTIP